MLHDPRRLLLIAGPCSLESEANVRTVAKELRVIADKNPELNIIAAYVLITCALGAWYMMAMIILNDLTGKQLLNPGKSWLKL